jgi:hypothetical protein
MFADADEMLHHRLGNQGLYDLSEKIKEAGITFDMLDEKLDDGFKKYCKEQLELEKVGKFCAYSLLKGVVQRLVDEIMAQNFPSAVDRFIDGITRGTVPDIGGIFTFHAPAATPIHYRFTNPRYTMCYTHCTLIAPLLRRYTMYYTIHTVR